MINIVEQKKKLRQEIKEAKRLLSKEERILQSDQVFKEVARLDAFKNAKNVLCYWALPDELDTINFVKRWSDEKNFYLPKVIDEELSLHRFLNEESMVIGAFNILEPVGAELFNLTIIDFAVVPGVAFTTKGNRMGRGGGFYDRLLPKLNNAFKVGVGYDFQLRYDIPSEPHDVLMDLVRVATK